MWLESLHGTRDAGGAGVAAQADPASKLQLEKCAAEDAIVLPVCSRAVRTGSGNIPQDERASGIAVASREEQKCVPL